jgi:hypothetical protein
MENHTTLEWSTMHRQIHLALSEMYDAPPCRRAAANLPVFLSGENFVQPVPLHDQSKLSAPRVTCGHLAAKSARATERWFSDQSLA